MLHLRCQSVENQVPATHLCRLGQRNDLMLHLCLHFQFQPCTSREYCDQFVLLFCLERHFQLLLTRPHAGHP